MLSDALKAEIQQAYTRFLTGKQLNARYGQRLMIAHIANALAGVDTDAEGSRRGGQHLCAIEAGTGTGKTLAYTVAALPTARALGKTLVITTATVALQEQILNRDLPDILHHSGLSFRIALAKGRRRYLCQARLDQWLRGADQQTMALYPDEAWAQPDSGDLALYQQLADALVEGRWSGDRDQWPEAIDEESWLRVTTDQARCTGRRCNFIKQCSYFRAREELADVEVIVANHDLVLADLNLGGGVILPPPEDCIYIVDEAHHLPDKVLEHFSFHLRMGATERWLEQSERAITAMRGELTGDSSLRGSLDTLMTQMVAQRERLASLRPLLEELLEERPRQDTLVRRFEDGVVPPPLREQAAELEELTQQLLTELLQRVDEMQRSLDRNSAEPGRELAEQWLAQLSSVLQRARNNAALWSVYAADGAGEEPPRARWLLGVESPGGQLDIELCCSPILAARTLTETLWARCHAAVLTSATLTALGSFDRFAMRAGLGADCQFHVVPSPFRYPEVAELHIPPMDCDPRDAEAHTAALVDCLPRIVDVEEGTLVLFASRRQMENVHDQLSGGLRQRVLMQGVYSRQEILRRHQGRIDAGDGSVIFGLASFAEGVDLPGDYCRHVIVAKIPFAVPDDPVEQALAEWIERNQGNAFFDITVPDAALRLVQASGRLLRNEHDSGRITLLDRRLLTRGYGRRILDSLPPFRRVIG